VQRWATLRLGQLRLRLDELRDGLLRRRQRLPAGRSGHELRHWRQHLHRLQQDVAHLLRRHLPLIDCKNQRVTLTA
jgi:hypothetical protein